MTRRRQIQLKVCAGTGCVANGARAVREALAEEIARRGLGDEVELTTGGCRGLCDAGPVLEVQPAGSCVRLPTVAAVPRFVEECLVHDRLPVEHLLGPPPAHGPLPKMGDLGFYRHQVLVALRNRGLIDPDSLDQYIARDGYRGVAKALLEMTPQQILDEIVASGLRGRGGAGFPTGTKWRFAAAATGSPKYILCNADEGDPGAFMDRSILESDPHAVLEGMIIGGRAIGAHQGYIYVRAEYPLAVRRLERAIERARGCGLLGQDILGSGFGMDIDLYLGAGAFVCGEETALMRSIEGQRGMPRPRPPFPAHQGLWGKPSVLNNVETFANVAQIILNGAAWYASLGTGKSTGTKVFALTGNVRNIGLIEVPMGTTLRTIVDDIGGGIPDKRKLKAVQVGGPSGGCIPEHLIDTPVDFESIPATGAIMGSGGMVVMDDHACMVDVARFFLEFTTEESCGKCTPCREGTLQMLEILTRICNGQGRLEDLETLEELAETVRTASLCGLGQTAPNPVLTTLRYFRHEYEEHLFDRTCRARRCKALLKFWVNPELCMKCGLCVPACPVGAIRWEKKAVAEIVQGLCTRCASCYRACRYDAIE